MHELNINVTTAGLEWDWELIWWSAQLFMGPVMVIWVLVGIWLFSMSAGLLLKLLEAGSIDGGRFILLLGFYLMLSIFWPVGYPFNKGWYDDVATVFPWERK